MEPINSTKMSLRLIKTNCNVGKISIVFQDSVRKHSYYFVTINHLLNCIPSFDQLSTFEDVFKDQFFDVIVCQNRIAFLDGFSEKIVKDFFKNID